MNDAKTIGEILERRRKESNLSHESLMYLMGFSRELSWRWVRAFLGPPLAHWPKIEQVLPGFTAEAEEWLEKNYTKHLRSFVQYQAMHPSVDANKLLQVMKILGTPEYEDSRASSGLSIGEAGYLCRSTPAKAQRWEECGSAPFLQRALMMVISQFEMERAEDDEDSRK